MQINLEASHEKSSNHRAEVLASEVCGCFYCKRTYPPSEITEWTDVVDGIGTTALCPRCGIDSVIGSASGVAITADFLRQMRRRWF